MTYKVVLKSLKRPGEKLTLSNDASTREAAENQRKLWRKALGNKNWMIDRRPGLDTLDHLALTIEKE